MTTQKAIRPRRRLASLLQLVLAVGTLALASCTQSRLAFDPSHHAEATVAGYTGIRTWADGTLEDFLQNNMGPGRFGSRMRILAISGGGSGGAFAAGLLSGWTKTGTRPEFDVVTGVSTGALIAPFAFLGPRHDEQLGHIYTSGLATSLVKPKFLTLGLLGSGLLESGPLRQLVETYANTGLMEAIAAEHRKGRRLFVVTTNLDAQRPVIWSMGAIAVSGRPDALRLFQDVLVASASIPAVYAPVLIKVAAAGLEFEEMHSDGAASTQVFVLPDALLTAGLPKTRPRPGKTDLYIIVNNALIPEFSLTSNSTFGVAARALSTVIKTHTRGSVLATYGFAKRAGFGFHLAAIDQIVPYDGTDPFNTEYMRTLFKLGYDGALAGTVWKTTPDFAASQALPAGQPAIVAAGTPAAP